MKNKALSRLLSRRNMNVGLLADQILSQRVPLTLVLLGARKGGVTWEKLGRVLAPDELKAAKEFADSRRRIVLAQKALIGQGIYAGRVTGEIRPEMRAAVTDYQRRQLLPVTGELDERTLIELFPEGPDLYVFKKPKETLVPA